MPPALTFSLALVSSLLDQIYDFPSIIRPDKQTAELVYRPIHGYIILKSKINIWSYGVKLLWGFGVVKLWNFSFNLNALRLIPVSRTHKSVISVPCPPSILIFSPKHEEWLKGLSLHDLFVCDWRAQQTHNPIVGLSSRRLQSPLLKRASALKCWRSIMRNEWAWWSSCFRFHP